ncbi:MAG: 30S ribosome-binding factor RbfA [Bacilli bacterium]|nr:30S ribosome-binding factor RbfA [Bacilli bacterium]
MADRTQRIQSIIGKNISEIIQFEVKNPRIGFCTVSEVEVSKDFSYAKVYVSFLGAKYPNQNLEELNKVKGYVRSSLARKIDIRKTPEIIFLLDETYKQAEHLEEVLAREAKQIEEMKKKNNIKD